MKKEAKLLLEKAVDSLVLSVEHFNRPWDRGRLHTVLILLDHAFEMLLKSAILHKGGKIRKAGAKETIGFDSCVRKCFSDGNLKFLTDENVLLLQAINSLRDAAQHHLLDMSEPHLYMQAQAGLTLFRDIMNSVFGKELRLELPDRVLPLSTTPPVDLATLFDHEVQEVRKLISPGKRKGVEARAKLRALAIMDGAIGGERLQPSRSELEKIKKLVQQGKAWDAIFPGVASINITHTGYGPSIDLRITKKDGIPVQLVPEGSTSAHVVAIRRVNELDFYNLGRDDLATATGLTGPKTSAVIEFLKLKDDPDCHKVIKVGKTKWSRYSQKAILSLKKALKDDPDILEKAWNSMRTELKARRRAVQKQFETSPP
jgi:hypothetical protein